MIIEGNPGWTTSLRGLAPGTHVLVFDAGIEGRRAGLELRDTVLVVSTGEIRTAMLFRTPITEPTVAAQVMKTGTGALHIDACRVRYQSEADKTPTVGKGVAGPNPGCGANMPGHKDNWGEWSVNNDGRWPTNAIFTHGECQIAGAKNVRTRDRECLASTDTAGFLRGVTKVRTEPRGSINETAEVWDCMPDCPVAALDAQTLDLHGAGAQRSGVRDTSGEANGLFPMHGTGAHRFGDTGGASRFFPQLKEDEILPWFSRLLGDPV